MSQHLRVLRESGVVEDRREGKYVYYAIANPKFLTACRLIRDAMIEQTEAEGQSLAGAREAIFAGEDAQVATD